jgi:DNA-binding NtrC family response regulator
VINNILPVHWQRYQPTCKITVTFGNLCKLFAIIALQAKSITKKKIKMLEQIEVTTLITALSIPKLLDEARTKEELGNYEEAEALLKPIWKGFGSRPQISDLQPAIAAEVLLLVGTLTGWIGYAKKRKGAQAVAIALIKESVSIFEELENNEKIAEAKVGIAICYWREVQLDEARQHLEEAEAALGAMESLQRARIYLNKAVIENTAGRLHQSLHILTSSAPLFEACPSASLKGKFHTTLGNVLHYLGAAEHREDYVDRALVEYTAACIHLEEAGNLRAYIIVHNQLAYLSYVIDKKKEAYEYLDRVQDIAVNLADDSLITTLDETRARILISENRIAEADRILQPVIHTLENGGDNVKLAEALTTYGALLARTGRYDQARYTLEQATDAAERAGDLEGAGRAQLTILEELGDRLLIDDLSMIYERADQYLVKAQHPDTLWRLRVCARQIINRRPHFASDFASLQFVHASKESALLLRNASRLARANGTILIMGEPGTGKEVLARLIHEWSQSTGEFQTINCATISPDTFDLELSSFDNGTLFLDEIADLSPENQMKLLRMIELKEINSVAPREKNRERVRIIASTTRNMQEQLAKEYFRTDLYYRLETFRLEIPPLRARTEDIPVLAEHFIREATSRHNKKVLFTSQALDMMRRLPLRGNARELRTLIDRTVSAAADGTSITVDAVETIALRQTQPHDLIDPWADCSLESELLRYEGDLIALALKATGGVISRAAALLGINHQTLGFIIESRQRHLLTVRKPVQKRRRRSKNIEAPDT